MNVLDDLYAVRVSLSTNPWDFQDWTQCTCGHVFRVTQQDELALAEGTGDHRSRVRTSGHRRYTAVLKVMLAAAQELGFSPDDLRHVVEMVSDATRALTLRKNRELARKWWDDSVWTPSLDRAALEVACEIVDRAIETEEAKIQAARLTVLAEAGEEPVEAREVVHA